jgi:DNA replication ATP-dependent helicase Dna2
MGASGLCEHRRVRTTCPLCRAGIQKTRHTPAPFRAPQALPAWRTDTQRARSDTHVDAFVVALAGYVEREKSASYARFKDNLSAPLRDRVSGGRAIEGVEVKDLSHLEGGADWAVLRCPANLSKFRIGATLLLHKGDASIASACRLLTDGELEFRVGAEFRQRLKGLALGPGWILDEGWSDYSENLARALDDLSHSPRRHWIHGLLSGVQTPLVDLKRRDRAQDLVKGLTLDEDQAEAFVRAYSTQNYHLVQGPPGSGKTMVLAQLAATLASEGQKVLVTAVTHRAINHALRKTQALRLAPDVVKIGGSERADDDVTTFSSFDEWRQQATRSGVVVGATCHSRLDHTFFDTVIFDESSQFPIPLAIRGMLYGKRYVFIGDDQQMDPVVVADHDPAWVAWSIFRLLKQHDPGTMLATTYRLNAELNAFPSHAFYEGRLQPSAQAMHRRVRFLRTPRYAAILDPEVPSVIVEVRHQQATVRSPEEARLAAALALDAVAAGLPASEVGIITPYRAQERLIRHELQRQAGRAGIPRGLVVETVERVQGQERDLTIISLTVSDLAYAADAAEFFFRPSRFNVALTRARSKRIVLLEPGLLRLNPAREYRAWVENLRAFHAQTPKVAPPS